MIRETCLEIDELAVRHDRDREQRYARRTKIHLIDELLNEFELLNLAEEPAIPSALRTRCRHVLSAERHAVVERPDAEIRIVEWMDALYDIQDGLMLSIEDDIA